MSNPEKQCYVDSLQEKLSNFSSYQGNANEKNERPYWSADWQTFKKLVTISAGEDLGKWNILYIASGFINFYILLKKYLL